MYTEDLSGSGILEHKHTYKHAVTTINQIISLSKFSNCWLFSLTTAADQSKDSPLSIQPLRQGADKKDRSRPTPWNNSVRTCAATLRSALCPLAVQSCCLTTRKIWRSKFQNEWLILLHPRRSATLSYWLPASPQLAAAVHFFCCFWRPSMSSRTSDKSFKREFQGT